MEYGAERRLQVWCVEYNKNEVPLLGNMILVHNDYLRQRYKNTYYYLRQYDDHVYVVKNCTQSEHPLTGKPRLSNI